MKWAINFKSLTMAVIVIFLVQELSTEIHKHPVTFWWPMPSPGLSSFAQLSSQPGSRSMPVWHLKNFFLLTALFTKPLASWFSALPGTTPPFHGSICETVNGGTASGGRSCRRYAGN